MLSPHSFRLISRVWLEVTESRFIASNERLFPSKVFFFGGGVKKRRGTGRRKFSSKGLLENSFKKKTHVDYNAQ